MNHHNRQISLMILHFMFGILIALHNEFIAYHIQKYILFILIMIYIFRSNYKIYLTTFVGIAYMTAYSHFFIQNKSITNNKINLCGYIKEYENYYLYIDQKESFKIKFYKNNFILQDKYYIKGTATVKKTNNIYNKINNILFIGKIKNINYYQNNSFSIIKKLKEYLKKIIIEYSFNSTHSSILLCIILGDTNALTKETRDIFNNYGISHILCISGLHVSSILLFGYLLFKKLLSLVSFRNTYLQIIQFQISVLISLILVIFYMIIAGGKISSIRAFYMNLFLAFSILTNQSRNTLENLLFIAFVILLIFPYYILYPSFQLSFLSVYIILKYSNSPYLVFYLFIFTTPISLYQFSNISLSSLVTNIVIIPITSIIIMPLIIMFLIMPIKSIFIILLNYSLNVIFFFLSFIPQINIYFPLDIYLTILLVYLFLVYSLIVNIKNTRNFLLPIL